MEGNAEEALSMRIMGMLMRYENVNMQEAKASLALILSEFDIKQKETQLAVCTEGKNERFIREFLLAKTIKGCTERTIKFYRDVLRRFLLWIGKDADAVQATDVQATFARMLLRGSSKCNCNNYYRALRSFYTWMQVNEKIAINPMLKLEQMKYTKSKEDAFTEIEIEKMRQALQDSRDRAIFELLLSTACRAAELASIKLGDITGDAIKILGKGEKYRTVYINARAKIALDAYLNERTDKSQYLFPGAVQGLITSKRGHRRNTHDWWKDKKNIDVSNPITTGTINGIVQRIAKHAGVEGAHTHRFRRTCATMALRHGMPIEQVSMMLGHAQIGTTQIYLNIREEDLKAAHKKYVNT